MSRMKVGVQLWPQHTRVDPLLAAAVAAEEAGADSLWLWDHFFPISGDPDGAHFECWTLLTAVACETSRALLGTLVTGTAYRNPDLLADMARTADHVSGGRVVLGIGAGWFERDHQEYGYDFGSPAERLADLEEALERITARLERLTPPPVGDLPILVGGGGEKVTLRLVAEHADLWNGFADSFVRKNAVLDEWCERVGRDPDEIERTVLINDDHAEHAERLRDTAAEHLVLGIPHPFDLTPLHEVRDLVG